MPAALLLALLLVAAPMAAADPLDGFLRQTLESARAKHHVPGAAVLVELDGAVAAQAAGLRAEGHPERVTVDDRWHIGSDTKAFTATMIMRLAERGVLSLDETLARCLPDLAASMDPAYREVTLAQLLSHTAGLPPLTDPKELPAFFRVIEGVDGLAAQRAAVARHYLSMPSASKPGAFAYSNLGYIIAGSIAESRTRKTWEDLVRTEVFVPLGITQAGFGPPGTAARIDQPRGHQPGANGLRALEPGAPGADNPPALGPAGTINISLADWARFARDQMDGALGHGKLLTAAGYRRLQTPVTGNYALGWGARLGAGGVPVILAHTGSNGNWLADIRIRPMDRLIELIALNAADEEAKQALDEIQAALAARLQSKR